MIKESTFTGVELSFLIFLALLILAIAVFGLGKQLLVFDRQNGIYYRVAGLLKIQTIKLDAIIKVKTELKKVVGFTSMGQFITYTGGIILVLGDKEINFFKIPNRRDPQDIRGEIVELAKSIAKICGVACSHIES